MENIKRMGRKALENAFENLAEELEEATAQNKRLTEKVDLFREMLRDRDTADLACRRFAGCVLPAIRERRTAALEDLKAAETIVSTSPGTGLAHARRRASFAAGAADVLGKLIAVLDPAYDEAVKEALAADERSRHAQKKGGR